MRNLLLLSALWLPADALACGQSTHIWIGLHAIEHLPPGQLKDLLSDPAMQTLEINGSMFPDGGYSPLTQDAYGEDAHWEPFQTAWMNWVMDTYPQPYSDEALGDIAFILGAAAHGMADQAYDGVFLTRSRIYDGPEPWASYNSDHTTDVVFVSQVGPQPQVDDETVPYDKLAHVFDLYGNPTEVRTMKLGQTSLQAAVQFVAAEAADPAVLADYLAQFPWSTEHLNDEDMPGSPACMGAVVAAYWQTLWDRLHGDFDKDKSAVIWSWPPDGSFQHERSAKSIESQISFVFARAVDQDTLTPDAITVTDEDGVDHPHEHGLYYGNRSNVVNLLPVGDWAEDTTYTVTVQPGVTSFDGVQIEEPYSFTFSTGEPPKVCGCASDGRGGAGFLVALAATASLRRRRFTARAPLA